MKVDDHGACAACGGLDLSPHLRVAGNPDTNGMIPTTDRYGTALADIVRCLRCGHMQLEWMPTDDLLGEAYAQAASDAYLVEGEGQRVTAAQALDQIERCTDGPGALLDLGCWVGFLLDEGRKRGWRVLGVEPSEYASAQAREHLGLEVIKGDLMSAPVPEGEWDAVVLGDVMEHLPRPGEALERIARLLRPDGVVYMALPDAGSRLARVMGARWWSVLPTHVQYFTRDSLATLLRRHGYEPLTVSTAPKAFTVRYYLDRIGGYSRPVANALVSAASSTRMADRIWAPDFGDRMAMLARAPAAGR